MKSTDLGAARAFQLAVGYAISGERMPLLLVDGAEGQLPAIQVAREGQWLLHADGPFRLTAAIFEQAIANHRRFGVDPYYDREHESLYYPTPVESRGWVRELFIADDPKDSTRKALFARTEWTDIGQMEVDKKYFRYVSMGIAQNDRDNETGAAIGARLIQVALCKNPFIKGMQPLSLTDDERNRQEDGPMALKLGSETLRVLALKDTSPEEALEPAILALAQRAGRVTELEGEVKALRGELAEIGKKDVEREVDAAVQAGKITPAERPTYLRLAEKDREMFREFVAQRSPQVPTEPVVLPPKPRTLHDGEGRQGEQSRLIADYRQKNEGATYGEALIACAERHPALFKELTSPIAVGSGALEGEG